MSAQFVFICIVIIQDSVDIFNFGTVVTSGALVVQGHPLNVEKTDKFSLQEMQYHCLHKKWWADIAKPDASDALRSRLGSSLNLVSCVLINSPPIPKCDENSYADFLPRDASTERGNATVSRLSVCLSVCLSVRPSVTFRYQQHIDWNSLKIISRPNSLRPVLWLTPNMGDLVQREHPQN